MKLPAGLGAGARAVGGTRWRLKGGLEKGSRPRRTGVCWCRLSRDARQGEEDGVSLEVTVSSRRYRSDSAADFKPSRAGNPPWSVQL